MIKYIVKMINHSFKLSNPNWIYNSPFSWNLFLIFLVIFCNKIEEKTIFLNKYFKRNTRDTKSNSCTSSVHEPYI